MHEFLAGEMFALVFCGFVAPVDAWTCYVSCYLTCPSCICSEKVTCQHCGNAWDFHACTNHAGFSSLGVSVQR